MYLYVECADLAGSQYYQDLVAGKKARDQLSEQKAYRVRAEKNLPKKKRGRPKKVVRQLITKSETSSDDVSPIETPSSESESGEDTESSDERTAKNRRKLPSKTLHKTTGYQRRKNDFSPFYASIGITTSEEDEQGIDPGYSPYSAGSTRKRRRSCSDSSHRSSRKKKKKYLQRKKKKKKKRKD